MKKRNKLYALLLTVVLVLGLVFSVSAAEGNEETPPIPTIGTGTEGVILTKHLELPEGIKEVPELTFAFEANSEDDGAGKIEIEDAVYSNSSDSLGNLTNDGKYVVDKDCLFTFVGTFAHAGSFTYTLKETANTNNLSGTKETVTYSKKEYTLIVVVANGENGPYVESIYTNGEDGNKQKSFEFTNTYSKNTSLTIEKNVVGTYADKTKNFTFKITFWNLGWETTGSVTGTIGTKSVACTVGTAKEFQLHDGESLVFSSLPVGTRYTVEEVGTNGYTPKVTVVENGTTTVTDKTTKSESGSLIATAEGKNNCLAGEDENKVIFTNTYDETPSTGIIMNNLPFLLLIGIGICALSVLAVSKKRRTAKNQ